MVQELNIISIYNTSKERITHPTSFFVFHKYLNEIVNIDANKLIWTSFSRVTFGFVTFRACTCRIPFQGIMDLFFSPNFLLSFTISLFSIRLNKYE